MLTQLIWKDLRICRLPILVGIAMTIGAFISSWMIYASSELLRDGSAEGWALVLQCGSTFSLLGWGVALTMLAGTIIAAERADRSSEFLAHLPPSRVQILLSKAIVLGALSVLALCVGGSSGGLANWLSGGDAANSGFHLPLRDLAPVALASIGVGWCASALSANTGPAVGLGFATPLIVVAALQLVKHFTGVPDDESLLVTYATCYTATGLACMVIGSVYFIRRVEP